MSLKLIEAVYKTHTDDKEFMSLLKLTPSSTSPEVIKRITKGMEPEITITRDTVPHVCMYTTHGRFARNHLVFQGKFIIDFYGKNSIDAMTLFERSFKLLHDRRLVDLEFHSFLCDLAYDASFATGTQGVKGYKAIYDIDYLRMN